MGSWLSPLFTRFCALRNMFARSLSLLKCIFNTSTDQQIHDLKTKFFRIIRAWELTGVVNNVTHDSCQPFPIPIRARFLCTTARKTTKLATEPRDFTGLLLLWLRCWQCARNKVT
jgi:hypothetical protein